MVAQIQVLECPDLDGSAAALRAGTEEILDVSNRFCEGMVKRGGGAKEVEVRVLRPRQEGEAAQTNVTMNM